jgi:hypothetical protein
LRLSHAAAHQSGRSDGTLQRICPLTSWCGCPVLVALVRIPPALYMVVGAWVGAWFAAVYIAQQPYIHRRRTHCRPTSFQLVCDWDQKLSFYMLSGRQIRNARQLDYDPCTVSFFEHGDFFAVGGSNKQVGVRTTIPRSRALVHCAPLWFDFFSSSVLGAGQMLNHMCVRVCLGRCRFTPGPAFD